MKKVITKFYFDKAKYLVGDYLGIEVFLKVDYKNGKFRLSQELPEPQNTQVKIYAQDMIKRKHGLNFSDNIKI